MPQWLSELIEKSSAFMPHGHCYLWIPSLLWMHVISDTLIGVAYLGISILLYEFVRRIRLPFSPVFIAFGLFIGLCGMTHFMAVWTVWNPDYFVDGLIKAATAAASVATAIGLLFVRPQVEQVVHAARLSEERRIELESKNAELEALYGKVTSLGELRTRFFANVSHELRTPLSLILGPAERLLAAGDLSAEQRRQLEVIARNGRALLKQVNDLLDVAKLEAGKMEVQYAELDAAALLRGVASQFEIAAQHRRIDFRVEIPDASFVQLDPRLLERVAINLISNAIKFTPDDGLVELKLEERGANLVLTVEDSGPGVAPEQRETIFERFRQVDGDAGRKHGGTGLGLAIVKEFVELHAGTVEVADSARGGAKFTVELPRRAPQGVTVAAEGRQVARIQAQAAVDELVIEPIEGPASASVGSPTAPCVLIVEDNVEMSAFIAGVFPCEYRVFAAYEGQSGLAQAITLRPDLIICDVMMPIMTGEQLVSTLRQDPQFDPTPILLLTAKADDELKLRLLRGGVQDYLTKPFQAQELLARANNLIAMKRAGDAIRTELASASSSLEDLARELALRHRQLQTALEAAQVAREQAQHASKIKSSFLGLISHELRTPLFTIHTNAQLLARLPSEHTPPVAQRAVERLGRATRQMINMIDGLLQFVRSDGEGMEVSSEPFDAYELAKEVIEVQRHYASQDVGIRLAPLHEELPSLVSEAKIVRIILDNLISNALKFTERGEVNVRVKSIGSAHVFEVQDTGPGIDEADMHRIFSPFEQIEPLSRKHVPGVGLGLALVQQLASRLGGRVEVESMKGRGSTFRVYLPTREEAAACLGGVKPENEPGKQREKVGYKYNVSLDPDN